MMSGRRKSLKQEKRPMGAFLLSSVLCLLALRLAGLHSLSRNSGNKKPALGGFIFYQ
jgi:hypothetical protein